MHYHECAKCNELCPDGIKCDICGLLVHPDCAGLSRTEVSCLRAKQRKISFYCENCDVVNIIKSLKDQIEHTSHEIASIKKEKSVPAPPITNPSLSEDDIINEIVERQQKAANIIVYNLPESKESSINERVNDDQTRCLNILRKNMPDTTFIKCNRLGKASENRPRPIKLQFASSGQVLQILRSYRVEYNIYLNRDLTIKQRNHAYNVRKEFRTRKTNGEEDIILKYTDGVPKIVKKNVH